MHHYLFRSTGALKELLEDAECLSLLTVVRNDNTRALDDLARSSLRVELAKLQQKTLFVSTCNTKSRYVPELAKTEASI